LLKKIHSCYLPKTQDESFSAKTEKRYKDGVNFLLSSLDSLFQNNREKVKRRRKKGLLLKKGIYPCEYMSSFERFSEAKLLAKEAFYSKLNDKNITKEENEHGQKVWEVYSGAKTLITGKICTQQQTCV